MKKYQLFIQEFTNMGAGFIIIWLGFATIVEWRAPGVIVSAIPVGAVASLILIIILLSLWAQD